MNSIEIEFDPANGPEAVGLAAAGDQGPADQVRIPITAKVWDDIYASDQPLNPSLTLTLMTAATLIADKVGGEILVYGLIVALSYKLFYVTRSFGWGTLDSHDMMSVEQG